MIPAVVEAVETADACLGRVVEAVRSGPAGSASSPPITATPRQMLEEDGVSPYTAHTTNLVPLILTRNGTHSCETANFPTLAPTVLALLGFAQPLQMTQTNLLNRDN